MRDGKWWHHFWARVFGKRVPTSGDRAHIDNMLVTYRPEGFPAGSFTDAMRVISIGKLVIYDYNAPEDQDIPGIHIFPKNRPQKLTDTSAALLAENIREYRDV